MPLTRSALPNLVLHLRMPVGTRQGLGRRDIVTGPDDFMFVADGREFTRHSRSGSILAIAPDENLLLEEIASRGADRPGRLMLSTRRVTIGRPALRRLAAALDDFVSGTAPGHEPRATRLDEAALLSFVAGILVEGSGFRPARGATCARLSEVENWIDANLGHPITAGQLCRIAGVNLRGLEKIFESRRGMSPRRFVAERRLAAANRLLGRAQPGDEVATLASSVGFNPWDGSRHPTGRLSASLKWADRTRSQVIDNRSRLRECLRPLPSRTARIPGRGAQESPRR
jgi:AraC-like DNA-binding protein